MTPSIRDYTANDPANPARYVRVHAYNARQNPRLAPRSRRRCVHLR